MLAGVANALPSWTRFRDAGSLPPGWNPDSEGRCVGMLAGGVSIWRYNCEYRQLCFTNRANVGSISKRNIVPALTKRSRAGAAFGEDGYGGARGLLHGPVRGRTARSGEHRHRPGCSLAA